MQNFFEATVAFDNQQEAYALLGGHDEFLHVLMEAFACRFVSRGNELNIRGDEDEVRAAALVMGELQNLYRQGSPVTMHEVRYSIGLAKEGQGEALRAMMRETVLVTAKGRVVRPKTVGQQKYLDAIRHHAVTFGVGPAGTGKTYLAVVMAVAALRNKQVSRIILTRPAVEAGERLGFLPGDMQEKVDPYLRPLYDSLEDIFGVETYQRLVAKGTIEIAPLAYMRGRTLEDAFIILDEAQNTTAKQMKMFLTRLGIGSKMVVTGDMSQIDLPYGTASGLREAVEALSEVRDVAISVFDGTDIIRHEVVSRIVAAYDRYEAKKASKRARDEKE
ncbi:PhoH family protein [Schwartzia sp. (in: firmicutes)]